MHKLRIETQAEWKLALLGLVTVLLLIASTVWWIQLPSTERPYPHMFTYRAGGTASQVKVVYQGFDTTYRSDIRMELPISYYETVKLPWHHRQFGIKSYFNLSLRVESLDEGVATCEIIMDGKPMIYLIGEKIAYCMGVFTEQQGNFGGYQDAEWVEGVKTNGSR